MTRILAIAALLLGTVPSAALANESGGGLISLDKSIVIQMINFGLLLFILIKLLYKPLLAKMEERTQAIRKSLEEAQAARAEAERERSEHAAKLQASYAEAQAIRAAALKEAGEEQHRLLEAARGEATRLVESARSELAQDVRRARHHRRGAPDSQEPARRGPSPHHRGRDRPRRPGQLVRAIARRHRPPLREGALRAGPRRRGAGGGRPRAGAGGRGLRERRAHA
jgi:F-type H+-transporting ATPase subunit b